MAAFATGMLAADTMRIAMRVIAYLFFMLAVYRKTTPDAKKVCRIVGLTYDLAKLPGFGEKVLPIRKRQQLEV